MKENSKLLSFLASLDLEKRLRFIFCVIFEANFELLEPLLLDLKKGV